MLTRIDIDMDVKGKVYTTLILNILLYGSESWTLTRKEMQRLRVFHARCLRTICRVNMLMTRHKHIPTAALENKLGIHSVSYYYSTRLLRWAGHVARMPMTRMPRKLLTGWAIPPQPNQPVANSTQMNWGRTLHRCLTLADLPTDFEEWCRLAQSR
jgi:hypothetical protein